MYIAYNKVRTHDTDMAGILYFPRQFRFINDALEDWMESEGYGFDAIFNDLNSVFVVVHAETDYISTLLVGDKLEVHVRVEKIGTTSFTVLYDIYKLGHDLIGTAKTVHVCVDKETRQKIPVPQVLRKLLEKYLVSNDPNQ